MRRRLPCAPAVLLKYVLLMLRADDHGEGGIIALYSIIKRAAGIRTITGVHNTDLVLSKYSSAPHDAPQRKHRVAAFMRGAPVPRLLSCYHQRIVLLAWVKLGQQPIPPCCLAPCADALKSSRAKQVILLVVVLLGVNLIISDGELQLPWPQALHN